MNFFEAMEGLAANKKVQLKGDNSSYLEKRGSSIYQVIVNCHLEVVGFSQAIELSKVSCSPSHEWELA